MKNAFVLAAAVLALTLPARAQLLDFTPPSTGGDFASLQSAVLGQVDGLSDASKNPRLRFGGLTLQTYYNASETYDTNIFLAPTGGVSAGGVAPVRDSWVMDNNLGFKSVYKLSPRHQFSLDYDFSALSYQGNGGSTQVDPYANNAYDQSLGAGYTYSGPHGISAKLRDNYINTTDPADTEITQRYKHWENMVGGEAEYSPSHTSFVSLDAEDTRDKYVTNDATVRALLDRVTQTIGGRLGYYVAPKTKVFVAYHAQDMHFTDYQASATGPARDSHADIVSVGVEGKIAPKLTASFETGYTYTHFAAAALNTSNSTARIWSFNGGLFYKPWEKTNVDLTVNRGIDPAVLGANQYYVATSGNLSIMHRFPWALTLGANGSIERDNYLSPISIGAQTSSVYTGNAYTGGVVAAYDFTKILRGSLNYMYISRFSNFAAYNYIDHRTSATLSLRY